MTRIQNKYESTTAINCEGVKGTSSARGMILPQKLLIVRMLRRQDILSVDPMTGDRAPVCELGAKRAREL